MPTDGIRFEADCKVLFLSQIEERCDLATKSTLNPDATTEGVFLIDEIVGAAESSKVVRGTSTDLLQLQIWLQQKDFEALTDDLQSIFNEAAKNKVASMKGNEIFNVLYRLIWSQIIHGYQEFSWRRFPKI